MTLEHDRRLDELFGAYDFEAIFNGDKASVPWATWARRPGTLERRERILELLSNPPVLFEVDPRLLLATQRHVVRHHFFHYSMSKNYEWFAQTSADHDLKLNWFPVLEPHGDRFVIRSGHHRSLVALLAGKPLFARVVGRETNGEPVAVSPLIRVRDADGPRVPTDSWSRRLIMARGAAKTADSGKPAIVRNPLQAQQVLSELRCNSNSAVRLLNRTFPGGGFEPLEPSMEGMAKSRAKFKAWASPSYCAYCGVPAKGIAVDGFSSCREHWYLPNPEHPPFDERSGRPGPD